MCPQVTFQISSVSFSILFGLEASSFQPAGWPRDALKITPRAFLRLLEVASTDSADASLLRGGLQERKALFSKGEAGGKDCLEAREISCEGLPHLLGGLGISPC